MNSILLAITLQAAASTFSPDRWNAIEARVNAQAAFTECPSKWLETLVRQNEPSEVIAKVAINLCAREEEAFRNAAIASMRADDKRSAEDKGRDWVEKRKAEIYSDLLTQIVLIRSDLTTEQIHELAR